MIPTLFFYELGLVALVWLFLMLYWLWPNDPATRYPTRPQLRVPRKRSNAPKLFVGLPHRADRKFKGPFRSAGRPSPALPAGVSAVPTALAAPLAGARRMGAGAVSGLPSRAGGRKIANGGRTSGPCPAPGRARRRRRHAAGDRVRRGNHGRCLCPQRQGRVARPRFFGVPPASWSSALPFHMTAPKVPSQRMKLPTCPCKDLCGLLQCTYGQIYDVVIAMDHLEHTQRPP
jgi:hypothetical protein